MTETDPATRTWLENEAIAVLGLGHVGLPTALALAELGWRVIGADEDAAKAEQVKVGRIPFFEPGVEELLSKHLHNGMFAATTDVEGAIRSASVIFICVGTPQGENGRPDVTQIERVSRIIARNLNGYKLIVEKSTVPAVTAKWIKTTINRYANGAMSAGKAGELGEVHRRAAGSGSRPRCGFDVASNPEFLREGEALHNIFSPDRIICGADTERAHAILAEIYRPLQCSVVATDLTTAELIKHASNAFLATKISYINMVADLCEAIGADVDKVACGIGLDPRIGSSFLRAGIGFGGYCLPKDLRAFIYLAEENHVDFSLLKEVERINQRRCEHFLKKVRQAIWVPKGKIVGIWGLAFKPDTDDIREAPSIAIIQSLLHEGAILQLYDPQAMPNMKAVFPEKPGRVVYSSSAYDAASQAHTLLLLTEWEEFRHVDLRRVRELMEVPVLLDGRNLFNPQRVRRLGFEYFSIGR